MSSLPPIFLLKILLESFKTERSQDFCTILNVSGLFTLRPNTFVAETPLSTPSFNPQVRLHL